MSLYEHKVKDKFWECIFLWKEEGGAITKNFSISCFFVWNCRLFIFLFGAVNFEKNWGESDIFDCFFIVRIDFNILLFGDFVWIV